MYVDVFQSIICADFFRCIDTQKENWLLCVLYFGSPVVPWTWYIGEELGTVKHVSQGTLQNLINHTLLHVHQNCLSIETHK